MRGAEPRFAMLQTIREFATEQLVASGELAQAKEAHASWFLIWRLAAEPQLPGPQPSPGWTVSKASTTICAGHSIG